MNELGRALNRYLRPRDTPSKGITFKKLYDISSWCMVREKGLRWADFKSTRAAKGASVGQPATMLIIDTNLSLYRLTFAFIQAIEKGQGITMLLTVGKASVGLRQVSFHSYYNDSLSLKCHIY